VNILARSDVLLTGESSHSTAADAPSVYSERSTLTEQSANEMSADTEKSCSAGNVVQTSADIGQRNAKETLVQYQSNAANVVNLVHTGDIVDSADVAARRNIPAVCASQMPIAPCFLSSQSAARPRPVTQPRQGEVIPAGSSSSACASAVPIPSFDRFASTALPLSEHGSASLRLVSANHSAAFKVTYFCFSSMLLMHNVSIARNLVQV